MSSGPAAELRHRRVSLTKIEELGRHLENGISRRTVCVGALSALGLVVAGPALGTEEAVRDAILEDFGIANPVEGDVRIDLPEFTDSGKSVPITVSVPCLMEGLDYPEVVAIYATRNPRPRILKTFFTLACSDATFATRIRLDSFQDIIVVVKMASGEIFQGSRRVNVTYGACEQAVATDQFPPGWAPSIKVSAPDSAPVGSPVPIRTIISHPMENGFRHNPQGLLIPVRIIESFRCYKGNDVVFAVQLEPAVAANPYFNFNLDMTESMDLHFEWIDTSTDVYTDDVTIAAA